MGKLQAFQIRLASGNAVYQAGDVISGDLLVRLTEPMKAKGIKISFTGEAYVHWTEQKQRGTGENRRTVTVHYRGRQNFFKNSIHVFGTESGDGGSSISQGEHVFPFSYQLPSSLPTSYEDKIGFIRYSIKATIDKPWKIDKSTKRTITVLGTLDLNTISDATKPARGTEKKYLCCLCCKSGPIKAEFQADRTAYVPGEFVTINASLKNKSSSKIKATSVSMMQKVSYHARGKTKIKYFPIAKLTGDECKKGKTIHWTNEKIQIPPLPPTETTLCNVLNIEYFLTFQGHLRMCAVDLREHEGIIIGTIPIRSLDIYQNLAAQQSVVPTAPDQVTLPSAVVDETDLQQQYSTTTAFPTPIYKVGTGEAVNLAAEDDDGLAMGDTPFSPQYTFYDWSQPAFKY